MSERLGFNPKEAEDTQRNQLSILRLYLTTVPKGQNPYSSLLRNIAILMDEAQLQPIQDISEIHLPEENGIKRYPTPSGDFVIFSRQYCVKSPLSVSEKRCYLTKTQWFILDTLVQNQGNVVPTTQLARLIGGEGNTIDYYERSNVKTHILNLRRKINDTRIKPNPSASSTFRLIQTVQPYGYRFVPKPPINKETS